MHSRIFQVSTEPIIPADYIGEADLGDDMLGGIADYFDSDTDRKEDIDWLVENLRARGLDVIPNITEVAVSNGIEVAHIKVESISFSYHSLSDFMEDKCNKIQEALDNVFAIDLNNRDDADELDMKFYLLESAIGDKFDFYIYDEAEGYPRPIDDFLRSLFRKYNQKDTYTYYIGATIDYHS